MSPASVRDNIKYCPSYDRTKAELEKESLTFAFALVYAAAHAGPKSGISEEPTYENVLVPAEIEIKNLSNSQEGADRG